MSYLKNSFNLCILEVPKTFELPTNAICEKFSENKFIDISPIEEFCHGWCAIDDIFKTSVNSDDLAGVNCIFGGYRYDKKSVPKPLIQKLYREKLIERKKLGETLNKIDRKILKEECKSQLMMKALPKPSLITWVWDLSSFKIYLDTKSPKIIESFLTLFFNTIDGIDLKISNLGLNSEDELINFLGWLWNNLEKREDISLDTDIILDMGEKTFFKFNGPSLENYKKEIETIKNSKIFKKLGMTVIIDDSEYRIIFNSSNSVLNIKYNKKIKHESVETAILDNLDRIQQILKKTNILVQDYLAGGNNG